MKLRADFDYSRIEEALDAFARNSRRGSAAVLRQQGKLLVRDAVRNTPPNRQSSYNRAAGVRTIRNDVRKVFRQSRNAPPVNPRDYERLRNRRGRIGRSLGGSRIRASNVTAFAQQRAEDVGILAGGFNSAAEKLGLSLPAWITRHGTRRGSVRIQLDRDVQSISIRNGVKFGGDVHGLQRRLQWALDNRARQMWKQIDAYEAKKAARAAGITVR